MAPHLPTLTIESQVSGSSDLKVTLAYAILDLLPCSSRFKTHRFHLFADFIQPILKLRGFHLNADLAALAYDVTLARMLDLPNEKRVLEATLRAGDADCLVFEHTQPPQPIDSINEIACRLKWRA
jgi:hypothetical protein